MIDLNARINLEAPNDRQVVQAVNGINRSMQRGTRTAVGWADAVALKGENFAAYSIASVAIAKMSDVIGRATRDAIRFESEMAKVAQTIDKTNKEVGQSTSFIRKVSREYALSNVKIAETVKVLAQAGLSFSEAKRGADLLAKTTLLASFDSIANTTDGLIAIMKQFNLTIAQSEKALESINVISKKYAVESADLVEAVKRTGGVFSTTGGKLNELLSIFTVIRDTTRESSETIATGIRTIFTRIQRPKTIEYFRSLGIELTDLKGNFIGNYDAILAIQKGIQKLGIASESLKFSEIVEELGGVRQSSRIIPLLTQSAKLQEIYQKSLEGTKESTKDLAKAQETLEFRVNQTKQNFSNLLSELSETSGFKVLAATLIGLANALIEVGRALKQILPLFAAFGAFQLGRSFARLAKGTAGLTPVGSGSGSFSLRGLLGYKRGGVVPGSGSGDTVPAMLEPGEFVLRKRAVNALGTDALHGINKYAKGGRVRRKPEFENDIRRTGRKVPRDFEDRLEDLSIDAYQNLKLDGIEFPQDVSDDIYEGTGASNRFLTGRAGHNKKFGHLSNPFMKQRDSERAKKQIKTIRSNFKPLKSNIITYSGLDEQSAKVVLDAIKGSKKKAGQVFTLPRFLSTSTSELTARGFSLMQNQGEAVVLKIKNFKGQLAGLVNPKIGDSEREVLLPHRSSFQIERSYGGGDTPRVFQVQRLAKGGVAGTDTVPSLLTPGEFVVNRDSAKAFGYGNLKKINKYAKGGVVSKFAEGGEVGGGLDFTSIISFGAEIAILASFLNTFGDSVKKGSKAKDEETEKVKEAAKIQQEENDAALKTIERLEKTRIREASSIDETPATKAADEALSKTNAASEFNRARKTDPSTKAFRINSIDGGGVESQTTVFAKTEKAAQTAVREMGLYAVKVKDVTKEFEQLSQSTKALGASQQAKSGGIGSKIKGAISENKIQIGFAAVAGTMTVLNKAMNSSVDSFSKLRDSAIENGDAAEAEAAARKAYGAETTQSATNTFATLGGTIGALFGPVGIIIGSLIGALLGFLTSLDIVRKGMYKLYDSIDSITQKTSASLINGIFGTSFSGISLKSLGIDFGSFKAEEDARAATAKAEAEEVAKAKKIAAQEAESKRAIAAVETNIAKQLAQSFLEVAKAADKAKNIAQFGDLANNLTSGSFRPTALSTGIEAGNVGSIRNAGKLAGSSRLAEQVIKNEAASKSIEKLSAELAADKINEKQFRERANEIGDSAGVGSIGETSKEGIQEFLDKIKDSGSKFKEELLAIASDSEKGFNSLLDAVDKAASAQVEFSQSLIDFGANQRGRRQELESFRAGGSTVGDIAFRRATLQTPTAESSAALRAGAVRSSVELAGTGVDIQRKAAAGEDTTKLQGNFAVLQLATKTQTELLKQDNQVRQQLIESLKESLSLEKERAGSLKDLGFGLKFGSEEEKAALATKAQQAQELEAKFRSGGVGVAVDTLAGQAESSSEAKEILSLLPAEIQQAIERAAGVQAGGQVGGRLGADIQNVALTGFTKAGQELVSQMAAQMNQQYANDLALLKIEQDNLSLLKQSAELMGAKIGDMINGFTSFGTELKNIVGSLQNASVQLTMAPANVVVTFNSPEGMDKLMGAVKQEIGREIAAQFLAREQGR